MAPACCPSWRSAACSAPDKKHFVQMLISASNTYRDMRDRGNRELRQKLFARGRTFSRVLTTCARYRQFNIRADPPSSRRTPPADSAVPDTPLPIKEIESSYYAVLRLAHVTSELSRSLWKCGDCGERSEQVRTNPTEPGSTGRTPYLLSQSLLPCPAS